MSMMVCKEGQVSFLPSEGAQQCDEVTSQLEGLSLKLTKKSNEQFLNYESRNDFIELVNQLMDRSNTEQIIEIRFTNINKNDPQKEFVLALNVGYSFTVKRCCPKIEKIDKLLLTLNLTADWHSFVVSVRKHFMNTVK
ncbi:hypothetical protein HELRODRAFT_164310 [Helobdella robusta]|uniref:Kinetochore protein SPC25 n=1 Tax=Helobdella robusta TaxID=6412 RepID=T1EV90_HELRO|nr:hypothetical protein HELRODRAFT_164310 [Helobdella robusta]ESN94463.1 hypothetical protein HELRODRAFT_164310 [Helobdella robusta]